MSVDPKDIIKASIRLASILDELRIPYALMGGSACALLGSRRATEDIDLCITPTEINGTLFDSLKVQDHLLKHFPDEITGFDAHGVGFITPRIWVDPGTAVQIDIFDPTAWPNRPQYNLSSNTRSVVNHVQIFSPSWLLREKIATIADRSTNAMKRETDLYDISFLVDFIKPEQFGKGELDLASSEYHRAGFNSFLNHPNIDPELRECLQRMFIGY